MSSPPESPSSLPPTEEQEDQEEEEDESLEVGETLRQLQHTHSRLRQEKEALEAYFIALESENERREESSDSLKERNHQLSAVTRRLTRLIRQAQAHIRELRMRLLHNTAASSSPSSSSVFGRIAAPSSSVSVSAASLVDRAKDGKREERGKDDENVDDEPLTYGTYALFFPSPPSLPLVLISLTYTHTQHSLIEISSLSSHRSLSLSLF
jgi:hypothetical protein